MVKRGSALEVPLREARIQFRGKSQRTNYFSENINLLQLLGIQSRHAAFGVASGNHGIENGSTIGSVKKETGAGALQIVDGFNVIVSGGEFNLFCSFHEHRLVSPVALKFQHSHVFSRENGFLKMKEVLILRNIPQHV